MSEEEHPCGSLAKGGVVCKVDEHGDVYCATPNACGMVGQESRTILVSRTSFIREEDDLRAVSKETRRIPLNQWNALEYLSCCVEAKV